MKSTRKNYEEYFNKSEYLKNEFVDKAKIINDLSDKIESTPAHYDNYSKNDKDILDYNAVSPDVYDKFTKLIKESYTKSNVDKLLETIHGWEKWIKIADDLIKQYNIEHIYLRKKKSVKPKPKRKVIKKCKCK
jgi:hypothetical protein